MKLLGIIIMLGLFTLQIIAFGQCLQAFWPEGGGWWMHPLSLIIVLCICLLGIFGLVVGWIRRKRASRLVSDLFLLFPRKSTLLYEHDCERCVSLGQYGTHDLYYCYGESNVSLIARSSSEPADYASAPVMMCRSASHPALRIAYDRYISLGY